MYKAANENTYSTSDTDGERPIGCGTVLLQKSQKIGAVPDTTDTGRCVPYSAMCSIMDGADRWRGIGEYGGGGFTYMLDSRPTWNF